MKELEKYTYYNEDNRGCQKHNLENVGPVFQFSVSARANIRLQPTLIKSIIMLT